MDTTAPSTVKLRRSPARVWAGRLAGILFGLIMAWLLVEVLLRLAFFSLPPRLQLVLEPIHVTPFSERRLLPDPIWQPDRKYQTINRPVQNYEQFGSAEVRYMVTTAAFAWGDPRVAFRLDPAQATRYVDGVAVGDSFTFCFVDESDCWVQQLANRSGRNLLNLGITSTGSMSHLRVLQDYGRPFKPRVVFWQWFGNDPNEDYGMALLDPTIRPDGSTPPESVNAPPPASDLTWWDENSAVYVLLKTLLGRDESHEASLQFLDPVRATEGKVTLAFGQPYLWGAFDMALPQNVYGWELTQRAIQAARGELSYDDDTRGTLVVLLMPPKELVYRTLSEPLLGAEKIALLDRSRQMMLDFCEQEALICLDLLPVFQPYAERGEQLYYTTDMHLNPRGNDVLAEYLAGWLAEHPEVFEGGLTP